MPVDAVNHGLIWPTLLSWGVFFLFLFFFSLLITWLMTHRSRILDIPNLRSSHENPIPKSGGLAVVVVFLAGSISLALFSRHLLLPPMALSGFLAAASVVAAISFYDDIANIPLTIRLGVQSGAAILLCSVGLVVNGHAIPGFDAIQPFWLIWLITYFWVVGLTNAFNFMDGLDGLAAGTAVLTSLSFASLAWLQGDIPMALTSIILLCSVLGMLMFNFPPARIFMGDIGSTFLGFVLAAFAIISVQHTPLHLPLLVMPLLLFHFLFDTTFTLVRRLLGGENITTAHRSHLYQLFNRLGFSHRFVSLTHYSMSVLQGMGALLLITTEERFQLLIFLPFLLMQTAYCIWIMNRARKAGLISG